MKHRFPAFWSLALVVFEAALALTLGGCREGVSASDAGTDSTPKVSKGTIFRCDWAMESPIAVDEARIRRGNCPGREKVELVGTALEDAWAQYRTVRASPALSEPVDVRAVVAFEADNGASRWVAFSAIGAMQTDDMVVHRVNEPLLRQVVGALGDCRVVRAEAPALGQYLGDCEK
jgi:hypothetical protein